MRDFDILDTNSFKAFWSASETLNFTAAANQAGLTQSGISQHIAKLERQLGVPLFKRVNKKVFLTEAGKTLRAYIDEYLDRVDRLKEVVQSQTIALTGTVSYAMPASCLMSPHLPRMLKKRRSEFPEVKFNISICPNDEVISKILNNEIQFGFVTKKPKHPGLKLLPYCQETYVLIAPDAKALRDLSLNNLKKLPFVGHPGVDVLFDYWKQFHFPKGSLAWDALNIHASVNSLAGAINMVEGGVGLTIVPEHCVEAQLKEGSVTKYNSSAGREAASTIYIVTLDGSHASRRTEKIIEVFNEIV